ncbi:AraC family transcriptional regulator [Streptomyces coelicoflavus]|uniref:AraC family transcriptional regulator n=1 Tax=Streptomyces coelicoflavus TaxID=285562 RepID=A0A7K3PIM1_9ACTN|nr:AraC family transcriptional regulator [Streptomyces coelicoflavus]
MSSTGAPNGTPPDWSRVRVAVPRPSAGLPGVTMAGFSWRAPAFVDMAMVAHPSVTLLIDLSEGDGLLYDARDRHGYGSFVVGLAPECLRAAGRVGECLQIRLQPVVAAAVFGPSAGLGGRVESFEDVWGRGAGRVRDELHAAGSWDERFAVAARLLHHRATDRPPVDPEVAHTWRATCGSRGRLRVDGLADEIGWSRKRLSARFRAQLGITPKRAARLVRFDHAAHLLAAGLAPATVASESGYADQSHLHREVKAFTGLTPTAVAGAPWLAIDHVAWPGSSPAQVTSGRAGRPAPHRMAPPTGAWSRGWTARTDTH